MEIFGFTILLFSIIKYKMGNTKRVKKVAINKPPITTVANGRCTSAPEPLLRAIGKKPKLATKAVINTGRSLCLVPVITTSFRSVNPFIFNRLNSESKTIPFKTATPNKAIKPTAALMLKGISRAANKKIPPIADSGMAV